jgi:hypothetical protein
MSGQVPKNEGVGMSTPITKELVARALPGNLKSAATDQLADMINQISADPLIAEQIRDNFLSYTAVLKEGKYKVEDYLNAVAYCSYKLMGDSNQDAYFKTFPQRYANLVAAGRTPKEISAYVAAYAKGQLVNKIMEQSLVPSWVLNQHMYQAALNTQFKLMTNEDVSPKVRSDAADSLLTHLTKPKEAGPLINIDMGETSGMNELKDALARMAQQQQTLINAGVSTKEIAAQDIVDVTPKEIQ